MVEEWEENTGNYQSFISEDLSIGSQQYLQDGHFTGDAGDLMVLTLANVLGLPITLFTSIQNMPVICVMPTSQAITSSTEPLLLAFTQDGPGHYDAVISSLEATTETIKCNCGRKPNFEGNACSSKIWGAKMPKNTLVHFSSSIYDLYRTPICYIGAILII